MYVFISRHRLNLVNTSVKAALFPNKIHIPSPLKMRCTTSQQCTSLITKIQVCHILPDSISPFIPMQKHHGQKRKVRLQSIDRQQSHCKKSLKNLNGVFNISIIPTENGSRATKVNVGFCNFTALKQMSWTTIH